MKKWLSIVLAMMLLCMPLTSQAAGDVYVDTAAETFVHGETTLPYRLMLPQDYDEDESYPLILFLHGAGERGTDNLTQMKNVFQKIANKNPGAILLAPQCNQENQWVDTPWENGPYSTDEVSESNELQAVMALLEQIQENYSVDKDRIYATGLSMGAFGVWDLMVRHNDVFAAGVACCGGGDPSKGEFLKDTPMYVFHGDADPTVPVTGSRDVVNAILEAGGETVFYTEYPGFPHGIWDIAFEEVGLFDALLEHRLSDRYEIETEDISEDAEATEDANDSKEDAENTQLYIYIGVGVAVALIIVIIVVVVLLKKKNKK